MRALRPYQKRMVDWILSHPKTCLFAGMGTGKTVSTLTAIRDRLHRLDTERVLIVAPLRVARSTWPTEIDDWEHLKGIDYAVLHGSPATRARLADGNASIHIINVDLFVWLVKHHGEHWPYDWLVLDESTLFKNPTSKRTKALKKVARKLHYYTALSGTPAPNGLLDLWAQVWPIDYGERMLGRTITSYRQKWFDSDWQGWAWTPRKGAQAEIEQVISSDCLSMTAASEFDLPPQINNIIEVDLPTEAQRIYDDLNRELVAEFADVEVIAPTAAVKANKLLQATAGAIYDEDGHWHEIHKAKIEALQDIVEEAAGASVLVAYQFKSDLQRLLKAFPKARHLDKNPATIKDWNAGKVPMLLAHPASAGHGLSLQHGGSILAFFSLGWSLEHYQQIIERIGPTRQAQSGYDRAVYVHHIVAAGTIDTKVMDVLEGKATVQSALINALKEK